ncbi:MAG TPA: alkane 1-monooxygenase [Nocardioidaceae bacterium]|nr:alkane 1-monooxygenase [Nocardioidaceae bacterium]
MATTSVTGGIQTPAVEWRDTKRYAWILGAIIPFIPFLAWGLVEWTGWDVFWFFAPVFVFGVIPLLDLTLGLDPNNPPDEVLEALEEDRYYRWVTYAFIPAQYVCIAWSFWMMTQPGIDLADQIGIAIGLGMVAGIAINTAHELGHKKESHERWLSRISLAQTFYGHFYIEHNRGHHVRVATPEDPASSKLGENIYQFLPRTMWGSLKNAWELESKRFKRLGTSRFTLKNDLINAWLMSVVLWGAILIIVGPQIGYGVTLMLLVVQGFLGIWLLESVNFLEHYGMKRQKLESGRFERVNPSHSWNSNNIGTNILLYHLQRHSDHHANPTRRYQTLRDYKEAPVLPTGYAGMIVLTWVPAIWRAVMDKRVVAHMDGDLTKANILPRKQDKYLRKYPVPEQAA